MIDKIVHNLLKGNEAYRSRICMTSIVCQIYIYIYIPLVSGRVSEQPHRMIPAVLGGDRRVCCGWVGDPFDVSFFVLFFFSAYSSFPMSTSIARVRVGVFTLCASILFIFVLLTSLFFPSYLLSWRWSLPKYAVINSSNFILNVLQDLQLTPTSGSWFQ